MATPNLDITEVAAAQNQKEVTINEALTVLDEATQGLLAIGVIGDVVITAEQFRSRFVIELGGSPTAAFSVALPSNINRFFAILNDSGQAATIELGDVSIALANDTYRLFYSTGSALYTIGGSTTMSVSGGLTASQIAALARIPTANPGNNLVWKTDGAGKPAWRQDATSGVGGGLTRTHFATYSWTSWSNGVANDLAVALIGSPTGISTRGMFLDFAGLGIPANCIGIQYECKNSVGTVISRGTVPLSGNPWSLGVAKGFTHVLIPTIRAYMEYTSDNTTNVTTMRFAPFDGSLAGAHTLELSFITG